MFVEYEKNNKIVIITLNRPDRLNALGREIAEEMQEACKKFEGDKEARVAIITGRGKAFSAGVDINEVAGAPIPAMPNKVVGAVTKPVIAAVNGFALGVGCLLMTACDIRITAESAKIGMPEIQRAISFPPDRLLIQGIPACAVMEIVLTGEHLSAQRAYEIGLVNKVVPDEELMPTAMKIAERIAELSPWAVHLIKEAAIKALALSKEDLDQEEEMRVLTRKSEDFQEAVKAFLEKRKPVFKEQ